MGSDHLDLLLKGQEGAFVKGAFASALERPWKCLATSH